MEKLPKGRSGGYPTNSALCRFDEGSGRVFAQAVRCGFTSPTTCAKALKRHISPVRHVYQTGFDNQQLSRELKGREMPPEAWGKVVACAKVLKDVMKEHDVFTDLECVLDRIILADTIPRS